MRPEEHILYTADFFSIHNFSCQCYNCAKSSREFIHFFSFCFIRKGHFLYHTYKEDLDAYTGLVLVNKPGYEYQVTHPTLLMDECTIFRMTPEFYDQLKREERTGLAAFLNDPDQQSILLRVHAGTSYLHAYCLQLIQQNKVAALQIDQLVMELLDDVLNRSSYGTRPYIPDTVKKQHLFTVESATAFLSENFSQDITLAQLAAHCHVSPFHFSRIFKQFTGISPYGYLLGIRLRHAGLLLRTGLPVADVAFACGFSRADYFSAAFHKKFGLPPKSYALRFTNQQEI